ncbi:MAG TPA: hypothetical protein VFP85_17085, partial [Vicinamibacterales bacterium]|nr:hypothetical protein [Vicinamibacterales bacterium]
MANAIGEGQRNSWAGRILTPKRRYVRAARSVKLGTLMAVPGSHLHGGDFHLAFLQRLEERIDHAGIE